MLIPKEKRLELNALSKEVYGSKSKWYSMLIKGDTVAGKTFTKNGQEIKCLTHKYSSLEEIEAKMKEIKVSLDKEKEDARRKSEATGSPSPDPTTSGTGNAQEGVPESGTHS